jgi:hypothetical protein
MMVLNILATATLIGFAQVPSGEQLCHRLTTAELEALLRGSRITQPDRPARYMRTPEEFRENGTYVRFEDNFEARGTYTFKDDAVCVTAERDPEVCRRLMLDKSGTYWISSRNNSHLLVRISVEAIR